MKRSWIYGAIAGLLLIVGMTGVVEAVQPFPTTIQIAINQLVTGVVPFTALRNVAGAYMNWGTTGGVNGYGFRDNAGSMQVKSSGGSWTTIDPTGSGDLDASYITRVPETDLTNETALSGLATGLIRNTTATGVPVIYAGTSCTNQFPRSLSAIGAATCASVSLSADVTGTLPLANGGLGLTSGTSGGILGFTAAGTLASSVVLPASRLVLGGGAGATPTPLGSLGTTTTVLHGNAAGAPTFAAITLTTDVTGILPSANGGTNNAFFEVGGPATSTKTFTFPNASTTILTTNAAITAAQGGTGQTTYAIGDLLYASGATALSKLAGVATGNALISGGVATAPSWGKIGLTTHVTGTLGPTNGGTGFAAYTTGDLLYAVSGVALARLNDVAVGKVLTSGGVATAPLYDCPCVATTTLTNAQIIALPNTPVTILAAPGNGLTTVVDYVAVSANFAAGAYTGAAADSYIVLQYNSTLDWSNYLANDMSDTLTYLSVFLDATSKRVVFREFQDTVAEASGWGPLVFVSTGTAFINQPLVITASNGGMNFGGGNAVNSAIVTVSYRVRAVP